MSFVDEAVIWVCAGDGGRGCVSFLREKNRPFGGPDGGDGGRGGDVIVRCSARRRTLQYFRYRQHFKASNGSPGSGKNRTGVSAEPIIVDVPPGTGIYDVESGALVDDLLEVGKAFVLKRGGTGGFGNARFVTPSRRAPRHANPGLPGGSGYIRLTLKMVADVGLVGLPNAGKSSLLAALTAARPKVGSYPFTTLEPVLGVIDFGDESFLIADLPGLIEKASSGAGLGHRFLRQATRCARLVHVVDITSEPLLGSIDTVHEELRRYGQGLDEKPVDIVLSKCDLLDTVAARERCQEVERALGLRVHVLSAFSREGLKGLRGSLRRDLCKVPFEDVVSGSWSPLDSSGR